jgi:hypothetical protein
MATHAVKNFVRTREFFKVITAIETGADHGMWTFQRYAKWLETRSNFFMPAPDAEPPDSEPAESLPAATALPALITNTPKGETKTKPPAVHECGRIEIEPVEGEFGKILKIKKS